MTSPRLEWVTRMAELWNEGDVDRWLDEAGPDFEFTPDPSFPDHDTYRGEEFREFMHGWARTWQDNRFELLGFEEMGDVGLMRSRWHLAAPGGSSGDVPVADFTLVVWWEGSEALRPHRMAAFFDDEAARAAALPGTG